MYEVRPWLYIGKYSETRDASVLTTHDIGAMLQLAEHVAQPGLPVLYLPVEDGQSLARNLLEQGVQFIRQQKAAQRKVLVACGAGISRSVAFAIAALYEEESTTLLETYQTILRVHPAALPHPELWESLRAYYDEPLSFVEMWQRLHNLPS